MMVLLQQKELNLKPMGLGDLFEVVAIERQSYIKPWSFFLFLNELKDNEYADYLVLKNENKVLGYGGMWNFYQYCHITNLAVAPVFRQKGYGCMLLGALLNRAGVRGARRVSLEVRATNGSALRLYEKMGFREAGIKKGYYGDEDAVFMNIALEDK
ncbi:ribosomal protein S18-alanine N-acetyltransferase [Candidatus Contubernalis alkaliaceticus]|uniref:ribosomal protein S18-alanine N-acetyltransferase n=1 Tax=Candidatus Contubernalis alkaliaceticus TaxID=338645 RepID=UPI001F4C0FC2|nr:ribosomal protein S18-alanine N-acetyltransferase [Candidatus Contubernalis alkalaceticus]UNC91445.1 ribosomal protein S18-alanine N-acetyltransferase [Candidatus Contubernalis alkalaceticus]